MQYWDGIQWTHHMKSIADLPPVASQPGDYNPAGRSTMETYQDNHRTGSRNLQGLPAAAFMIVFGLVFIGIGSLPMSLAIHDTFSNDPVIEGTVVDVRWKESRSSSTRTTNLVCSPVSSFSLGGKEYTVNSNSYNRPCKWEVGQPIELVYDPANPQNARAKATGFNPVAIIFPAIGALVAGLGVRNGIRELRSMRARS